MWASAAEACGQQRGEGVQQTVVDRARRARSAGEGAHSSGRPGLREPGMAIRAEAIGDIFAGDGAVTSTSRSTARPSLLGSQVVIVVADAIALDLAGLFVGAVRVTLAVASAAASSIGRYAV